MKQMTFTDAEYAGKRKQTRKELFLIQSQGQDREGQGAGARQCEHPFRVIKRQFGYVKARFRGLAKNTAQLVTLFALSNLWMARRNLLTNVGGWSGL